MEIDQNFIEFLLHRGAGQDVIDEYEMLVEDVNKYIKRGDKARCERACRWIDEIQRQESYK